MAKVSEKPIEIPSQVQVMSSEGDLQVTGPKGEISMTISARVKCVQGENSLVFEARDADAKAIVGTMRSLAVNMIVGVSEGFEKRLLLQGVGYRAQEKKDGELNLQLGYSHPIVYKLPAGVQAEIPSQTEIIVRGVDKQKVGQAASEIRAFRPPEPYKGKGVRYADERITLKEGKKK